MNLSKANILAALLLFSATDRLHAELIPVIEVTDLRGNSHFQVCTEEEKKKIEAELKAETKFYPKALADTKADWLVTHKDTPFPSSRLKQRTLRVISTAINREAADKLLSKNEERKERALANNKADEEATLKKKPSSGRKGGNQAAVKREQDNVKEDRERNANADKAETILRQKLSAAAGHEVPFYGEVPVEQKQAPAPKKK